ncbi:Pro-kumamolisin, activation domain-containing protein, partial [Mycena pura]
VVLAASAAGHSGRAMAVHQTRDARAPGFVVLASHQQRPSVGCASLKPNDNAGPEIDRPDPASARYGQFLTNEEVRFFDSFSTPKDETIAVVNGWKNNIEAATISPSGDMLQTSIPVPRANELLRTQFDIITHIESGETSIRTPEYSILAALEPHIDYVHPTTMF